MRKVPHLKQWRPSGRPMANSGGLRRQVKRIRKQIKKALQKGAFDFPVSVAKGALYDVVSMLP